jgi:hypothetical protein
LEALLSAATNEMAKLKESLDADARNAQSRFDQEIESLKTAMAQTAQEKQSVQKALATLWEEKGVLEKRLEEEQNRPWWKRQFKWV